MFPFFKPTCEIRNASVGTIDPRLIATEATITNAYINDLYPNMTIGGKVIFSNVTDAAGEVIVVTKLTTTTWYKWTGTLLA